MPKRKYTFIAFLLVFLTILFAGVYLHLKRQEHLVARHHLLCEVLKPGMSFDEVLGILYQAGEFTTNRKSLWDGNDEVRINFIDAKGRDLYGGFDLLFFDYKYGQAAIHGFDYFQDICHIPQWTPSVTEEYLLEGH